MSMLLTLDQNLCPFYYTKYFVNFLIYIIILNEYICIIVVCFILLDYCILPITLC